MKEYQKTFLNLALNAKALEFGTFTLKSGRTSPYFFNAAKMLNGNLSQLANCYVEAINEIDLDFDCIYGPAYKGIFLGSMIATVLSQKGKNYPLSFNRKEVKDHGEGGNIIGPNPEGNVMIVDDVLSAGTAVRESIELIKNIDANPKIFVVGLNRQEKGSGNLSASDELQNDFGITVKSIVDLNTLISFSETNADYQQFLDELKNYREEWGA
ncbi:MAG: orotate phosphoribosyltransferase [Gammaproteobacteria bacterium]|uniref:Orotate phosphoribosyltransferase n=1 Tax=SAR86 cluster bacterium TaxID=2030880 RepID=A0A520MQ06_9GAMM|nr:MAG: orotate phosphoribosyltransferase [SAR86 cluster bacterium]